LDCSKRIRELLKIEQAKFQLVADGNGVMEVWTLSDGSVHRDYGPAIIWKDGTYEYFKNNENHNENGPAQVYKNGSFTYHLHGQFHRTDGPAVYRADDNTCEYYINGQLHRLDGPAVVSKEPDDLIYAIHGEIMKYEDWVKKVAEMGLPIPPLSHIDEELKGRRAAS
jgi:hypothetical protein